MDLFRNWKGKKKSRTGEATGTETGAVTDAGPSTAAAVPEKALSEVNEVGCTVIYEGEEPLLAE
jgi:hypothetical protein